MPLLPDFDQAQFNPGAPINNRYYPLKPGTVSAFLGTTVDGETAEGNDYFVTSLTENVFGVTTLVIRDTAYEDDVLVEETIDFFAQDKQGNVWYFGERVINYEYDDDGNFVGTDNDGQWRAGEDDALPGWIMPAKPTEDLSYYNEFAPDVALDEALVLSTNEHIETELRQFVTLKTLDTSELDPGIREFKYYAPGLGTVRVEEELDENDVPGLTVELREVVRAGTSRPPHGAEEVEQEDFVSDGSERWITIIANDSELNNAIGYYVFDVETGEIGEGRILFEATDEIEAGATLSIEVPDGSGIGLFFVPDGGELGVDLSDFTEGGLFFTNMQTDEAARLTDGMAPLVTDAEGEPLPIPVFHALGASHRSNLLNPGLGLQAAEWELPDEDDGEAALIGFEDQRRTQEDYDGDFDDVLIAYSDSPIDIEDFLDYGDGGSDDPGSTDWRLLLNQGFTGEIGGSGLILGSHAPQDITVVDLAGTVSFDPSFNRGGDIVRLAGDADSWQVSLLGSSAVFSDGDTFVQLPAGTHGTAVVFGDGPRTLRFDPAAGSLKLGEQSFAATPVQITAPADSPPAPANAETTAPGRLILNKGAEVSAGGTLDIFGTAGGEDITLVYGDVSFDPSFNNGGDTLVLNQQASDFIASRQGSSVLLDGPEAETVIPVGNTGMTLSFADADARTLFYDTTLASIVVGTQTIESTPVALTDFA